MNFKLTEDQLQLQEAARTFARAELPAIAAELERDNKPPSRALVKRYAEMGFLGINVSSDLGGLGLGNIEALIVLEEFGKISSAVGFPIFESSVGPVRAIEHFASDTLKKRVVPAVCSGDMVVAVSMSEPDAGSALTDLKTKGVVKGDKLIINGTKRWCSGGGHSDAYVVYCRLSDDPGAKGIGAVLVEKDAPGISFGPNEELMGFRGVPSSDINFDDCEVPLDNIIVQAGGGFKKLMEAFDLERCGNATMSLAQASGALEDVSVYVQERKQFGKPIAEFQAVQIKLAEMQMKIEAARLLIWRAASLAEDGLPSVLHSSTGKCFANTIAREVTGDAMQLMGAYGYSKEFPMERRLRDSWGWGIAGGAIDIQKVNIAGAMLGRRFDQRR
ncbi:acyl-CoA dehydrogenase family protein [Novosphingobium resinovorum]|uniref:Acyl-CoA dehydrogenase domain-containing protein n=1 Tax=Novosphingobium resinovorum TaxID=158500 RepID=A0A031JTS8_9SPHN|nr:acyl-CoA dehydrogenase family protein [Novosphingobium resinovorum]AOR79935.1 butyryl-CoA dehydrogenase [Novosphingobium resinovorum]EZP81191.1 Acyl-CoA dehydrogenase domain-containing protein [Novosphingobium resinovorum]